MGFKLEDKRNDDADLKSIYFEAKRELTLQKDGWWLTSGLLGEYVHNTSGDPEKLEAKLLLQRNEEKFRHRFNLIAEREIGGGASNDIEIGTRAYSRYNLHENFKPAIEWHAEWGTLSHIEGFSDQKHWIGPGVHGYIYKFEDGTKLEYETAYNFGITRPAEDGVLRVKLELKKQF